MLKRAMLGLAVVVFAASAGLAAPQAKMAAKTRSWAGIVTDSKCATNPKMRTNEACIKKCVSEGAKYVLYDTSNHKVYQLEPQSEVAEHAAHHVRVYGTMEGDTIQVTRVRMLGMAKKPAASPGL